MNQLSLDNIVGGGEVGVEIDLSSLANTKFKNFTLQYKPEAHHGLVLRTIGSKTTITLYRSGKFSIAGGSSVSQTKEDYNLFCNELENKTDLDITPQMELRFFVTSGDLNREIDLSNAAITLGTEVTEYEPEQFPGLFYRPVNKGWFAILFASGSIIIDGEPDMSILQDAYDLIDSILSEHGI